MFSSFYYIFSKSSCSTSNWISVLFRLSINSGADIGIELELVLGDFIEKTDRNGMYKALVPLVTSTNLLINLERVSVEVPQSAPFVNVTEQWERRQEIYSELQETSFNNVERKDERFGYVYILENSGQNAFSIIEINDIIREIMIPTLIIQPKVITGNKPEKTKEENPAIVVSAVKRQGFIII